MGKVTYATGIDHVSGSLAKPKVKVTLVVPTSSVRTVWLRPRTPIVLVSSSVPQMRTTVPLR